MLPFERRAAYLSLLSKLDQEIAECGPDIDKVFEELQSLPT
jgi:hypothetical protein